MENGGRIQKAGRQKVREKPMQVIYSTKVALAGGPVRLSQQHVNIPACLLGKRGTYTHQEGKVLTVLGTVQVKEDWGGATLQPAEFGVCRHQRLDIMCIRRAGDLCWEGIDSRDQEAALPQDEAGRRQDHEYTNTNTTI